MVLLEERLNRLVADEMLEIAIRPLLEFNSDESEKAAGLKAAAAAAALLKIPLELIGRYYEKAKRFTDAAMAALNRDPNKYLEVMQRILDPKIGVLRAIKERGRYLKNESDKVKEIFKALMDTGLFKPKKQPT